jgi:hypothetical protein
VAYLGEPIRWNVVLGFVLIGLGATFVFEPWKPSPAAPFEQRTP